MAGSVLYGFLWGTPCVYAAQWAKIEAGHRDFVVEVVSSEHGRQKGLMDRSGMPEDRGMLFVMPEVRPVAVWMKNMQFPLDVIWLSERATVLAVRQLQPCTDTPCEQYRPRVRARFILEVNEGKFPLKIGDIVEIHPLSGDSLRPHHQDEPKHKEE